MNPEWIKEWATIAPHTNPRAYVVEYLPQDCCTGAYKADFYDTEAEALHRADQLVNTLKNVRVNYPDGFSTRVF